MDLSLGITGPIAGFIMSFAGVQLVYLLTALLVGFALLCTLRMIKRQAGMPAGDAASVAINGAPTA